MNDERDEINAGYFAARGVVPNSYDGYVLPAYLKRILPADHGAAILDIGCGFGQMLQALKTAGYIDLAGIDVSDEAVMSCMAMGLAVEKIESLEAYCFSVRKGFDFIIMSHVIEHIDKTKIIETLSLVRTLLLKEGGRLVVITPNAQSPTGSYWAYEDFTHTTIFTAGSLYFVLRRAGFKYIEFIDVSGIEGSPFCFGMIKKVLLFFYKAKTAFWNRVTNSSFHRPSPQIFTFEIKAVAGE